MTSSFLNYENLYLLLILISYLFCYLKLDKISKIFNLYDYPDGIRKIHKIKTPLLGGIFLFFAIFLYITIIPNLLDKSYEYFYLYSYKSVISFFFCFISIFILGFLDDKYSISPDKKLIILFFICYIYVISDSTVGIENIRLNFLNLNIEIKKFTPIFTSVFIATFIILSNMFDGINGQSSIFFIFTLIVLTILNPVLISFIFFLVLLLLIFVFYNLKSKIFLGDNGIFILGFIISILYLKTYNIYGNISFDHLILISFLPLIDMIRVSVFRIFNGKNPMRPDMTHIHHIITNAEGKLIKIIILTISPIIIYYFTNNFLLTSSLLLILYFYIILNKKKNEIL